jgi:hypothetical protein
LLPLVEFGGELAAGKLVSVLVENDAQAASAASKQVGAFACGVGSFDRGVLHRAEFLEAAEVFVATSAGVSEGRFPDGEKKEPQSLRVQG